MISFDLCCGKGHRFEGWFASSADYETQNVSGLLTCPMCDDASVQKLLSVPNIGRKSNQPSRKNSRDNSAMPTDDGAGVETAATTAVDASAPELPVAVSQVMQKMAAVQTEMLKDSQWVGRQFAETARAIHYGESDDRLIHGEASPQEAYALVEEGVGVAPLPFPFIPPEAKN